MLNFNGFSLKRLLMFCFRFDCEFLNRSMWYNTHGVHNETRQHETSVFNQFIFNHQIFDAVCIHLQKFINSTFVSTNQWKIDLINFIHRKLQFVGEEIVMLLHQVYAFFPFLMSIRWKTERMTSLSLRKMALFRKEVKRVSSAICYCRRRKKWNWCLFTAFTAHLPYPLKWHTSVEHDACSVSIPMHLCSYLSWCDLAHFRTT